MYTQFFHLKQSPFSIAPDPRYLFMSERHREALAHLLYGVGSGGGFVLLTGEIGAGKTTVCRCFMEQIPANCRLAYIFNPKLTVEELLQSVCDEFRIEMSGAAHSVKGYVDAINAYLLSSHAQGLNNVLVIDEAQNLSAEVLEQLRLLTNLETSERKLLQIILIGQPELRGMLARPELEQLAQRVIARYHLGSLSEAEVGAYVEHRLTVAGASSIAPFPRPLMAQLHQLTKGVPRRINLLCDRALLGAYVENQHQVTSKILRRAAEEVFAGEGRSAAAAAARGPWPYVAAGVFAGVVLTGAAAWQLMPGARNGAMPPAASASSRIADARLPASNAHPAASASPAAAAIAPNVAPSTAATNVLPAASAAVANAPVAASSTAAAGAAPAASSAGALAAALPSTSAGAARNVPLAGAPQGAVPEKSIFEDAVRALATQWGVQLAAGEGCPEAAKQNLRCLLTKGGLSEIKLLDRPVLIKLRDDPTRPTFALLTAMNGDRATLSIGAKRESVTLASLEARFDGGFLTFWRAPRTWRDEVSSGDKGPDVDWLARRLAELRGAKKPKDNQPLDGVTLRALRDFQVSQNLKADGVAGPKTFIRLNQLGGVQEPRLSAQAIAGK